MGVIPLNDRVLIRPHVPPPSEIIAMPEDHYEPEQMGVVVALGSGIESRKDAVRRFAEAFIETLPHEHVDIESDLLAAVDAYQPEHVCQLGDMVCFHPKDGQELKIDGELHLILREDDLLAVVEPIEAA